MNNLDALDTMESRLIAQGCRCTKDMLYDSYGNRCAIGTLIPPALASDVRDKNGVSCGADGLQNFFKGQSHRYDNPLEGIDIQVLDGGQRIHDAYPKKNPQQGWTSYIKEHFGELRMKLRSQGLFE